MAEVRFLEGVASAEAAQWNALVGDGSPFLEWEFLASLEEAGCVGERAGWLPRPLVAVQDGELVAACPVYLKAHSEGEFVFDWSWADAAQRAGIPYYPKVLVGVPFTPVTGHRFLTAPGLEPRQRRAWIQVLGSALRDTCSEQGFSGVHVNFCGSDELEGLRSKDYLARTGMQYHWINQGYRSFDDYLHRFRSKRRNQIRRELRRMDEEGIEIQVLAGDQIPDELIAPMYTFYEENVQRHYWGRQYLNRAFFELLGQRFRHRLCFVVARQDGQAIAGAFNVQKGDALYGRYWGATRDVRHLHFNVCYYAGIRHCIEHGLARFEPGAGGDYKQLRGFDATPTRSAHHLQDPRLAEAIARYLKGEREEYAEVVEQLRIRSALKKAE